MPRCCTDPCVCLAVIPACLDTELTEFPLRMRDWLKNVLITLYERDEDNNLLTEKQKLKVGTGEGVWELIPTVEASTDREPIPIKTLPRCPLAPHFPADKASPTAGEEDP